MEREKERENNVGKARRGGQTQDEQMWGGFDARFALRNKHNLEYSK